MDYKSIIVFLDNSERSNARMGFAIEFARRCNAHLRGTHLAYVPPYPPAPAAYVAVRGSGFDEYLERERSRVECRFIEAARRAGLSFDWTFVQGQVGFDAPVLARSFDLIIAGQVDRSDAEARLSSGVPESLVLGSGRPMLMLPFAGVLSPAMPRVLVAWNGARESARAVADALPLLAAAASVAIVTVAPALDNERPAMLPALDVAQWLSRHGVKAEVMQSGPIEIDVGEWLLSRAADFDAHLIVAGAYGHTRVRELVLGGVTRTLLESAPVPVLMSH
jgi:nucleotide-binding universal stress UspA family protein